MCAQRGGLPGALPVCMRTPALLGWERQSPGSSAFRVAAGGQHRGRTVHFSVFHVFCSAAHLHTAGAGAAARGAHGRALRSFLSLRSRAAVARCALPRGALAAPKRMLLHCLWHSCPLRLAYAFQAVGSCTCNTDEAGRVCMAPFCEGDVVGLPHTSIATIQKMKSLLVCSRRSA